MKRYKLIQDLGVIEEREDGFFVKYSDVEPIIKAISMGNTDDYGDLIIPVEYAQTLLNFAQVKR